MRNDNYSYHKLSISVECYLLLFKSTDEFLEENIFHILGALERITDEPMNVDVGS